MRTWHDVISYQTLRKAAKTTEAESDEGGNITIVHILFCNRPTYQRSTAAIAINLPVYLEFNHLNHNRRPFICPNDGFHQISGTSGTPSYFYCFKDFVYEMVTCLFSFWFNALRSDHISLF